MRPFQRFARNARVAVMLAQEEARELCDRETGSQHLLLGILQAAGEELSAVLTGYGLTTEVVRAQLAETSPGDKSFDEDADALSTIGIDLRAVRDSVARTFGADAFDQALSRSGRRRRLRGHISFSHGAKKVLELALREALAHKDNEIRCEHLLLGILRSGDKAAIDLITEHVYTAQLRAVVVKLMDKAA
ncbi:MAG TPA: Clp protease N-terminal domain-containing protein [Mycobacterium sp.]|uniref:Clp protease N-terminal domain-containing protein n=1 Tax=Mycobacterium sp. TaxID=1785 RepID=UPI002D430973|nr:Clp protease N-terminal domain-containing protein [Mycobacterium sp.]HXY64676.1 Clp protease N-terminal domain-containing protein [Mycobacterium sp.]